MPGRRRGGGGFCDCAQNDETFFAIPPPRRSLHRDLPRLPFGLLQSNVRVSLSISPPQVHTGRAARGARRDVPAACTGACRANAVTSVSR